MSDKNIDSKEIKIMAIVIVVILVLGFIYIFNKGSKNKNKKINRNEKRYSAGQLHYVDESLMLYKQKKVFKSYFDSALGIVFDSENNLYVCGNDGVRKFDSKNKFIEHFYFKESIRCMAFSPKVGLLCGSATEILILNTDGKFIKKLANSKWGLINSIITIDGYLFIADRTNRVVWKCDLNGEILLSFGSSSSDKINGLVIPGIHLDLAISQDKLIYVSNPGRHQINSYEMDGKLKAVFGRPSFKHEGFCGCCNPVSIAVIDDQSIMTSEKGIARVKSIAVNGDLLGVIAAPIDFKNNKHAYTIDSLQREDGFVYLLETETNNVWVYEKR
jgi:hypothetical protein